MPLTGEVATKFMAAVLTNLKVKRILSSDYFSVGGVLLAAFSRSFGFL